MNIQYIKHHNIDFEKYDYCIENSSQGTVYAMSWYLDVVSPGWDALMADDYSYVMPVPVKKKYFFRYATQPLFCQQLGVFSLKELPSDVCKLFIESIPYNYYQLHFNAGNILDDCPGMSPKSNYRLDLNRPYEEIKTEFSKNCLRNIKKAENEKLMIDKQVSKRVYLEMIKESYGNRPIKISIPLWNALIIKVQKYAKIEIWGVSDESTLLSCAAFIQWKNIFYYLEPMSTASGKQKQSMSFLITNFIQKQAGSNFILDFEGSSVPNVARFYEGFGSKLVPYFLLNKDNILSRLYKKLF